MLEISADVLPLSWMFSLSVDPNPTKVEKHCKEGTSGQDEECPKEVEEACKFCKEHSRCVEVVYRNEQNEEILTRVRFQLYPEVSEVSSILPVFLA